MFAAAASFLLSCFFFHHTATTEIYTLSLHDALPICLWDGAARPARGALLPALRRATGDRHGRGGEPAAARSEEHTSELQSLRHLVCRLLLEKKNKNQSHSRSAFSHTYSYLDKQNYAP